MRRVFKYTGLVALIFFIAILIYYSYAVYEARRYTQRIILQDIQKSQWRSLNGEPKKFDIESSELTERQRKIVVKPAPGVDKSMP